ncbi:MAG TPA: hypothetical protein VI485_16035 [Vicinamibacterales bacterium]|nr:hypothetical protein [Vicinamibacterales bacterium]
MAENRFVVFGDLMGFASLVEDSPEPEPVDLALKARGGKAALAASMGWQNPLSDRYSSFHNELARALREIPLRAPVSAVVFSDSFFVASEKDSDMFGFAEKFMRTCMFRKLPLRVGIGYGSFVTQRFSYESTYGLEVISAQFLGTGVVNAHRAERSDTMGLRIFVHRSAVEAATTESVRRRLLSLHTIFEVSHELSYMPDGSASAAQVDETMAINLSEMANTSSRQARIQRHYMATRDAISLMLETLGRGVEWPAWRRDVSN